MKKKFIMSVMVAVVLFAPMSLNLTKGSSGDSIVELNTAEAAAPKWLIKLTWPVINKAGNKFYNVKPSYTKGKYADKITPGSINYNNGKYGASSKFKFKFASKKHSVNLYANTAIWNLGTKIAVILENPKGKDVINRSVDATQWSGYSPGVVGNYTARFVQTKKQKWTPYLVYRYDTGAKSAASTYSSISDDSDITNHFITDEKYGNVITPSKSHKSAESKSYTTSNNSKKTLTAEEIDEQYYDSTLGVHVLAMKDYRAGDIVNFKDEIIDIKYDEEDNITKFIFEGDDQAITFEGDLSNDYQIGQQLNLKFKVEKLSNDNPELAVIDYLKYVLDNNKVPTIDSFLDN